MISKGSEVSKTLRERVSDSINQSPRSLYDLARTIALFIPEDHPLANDMRSCLSSMEFAPPENHGLYMYKFLLTMSDIYPTEDAVLRSPWWNKVVCMIVTGGATETSERLWESLSSQRE